MALERSWGNLVGGRSADERAHDRERIAVIESLLPSNEIEQAVVRFYASGHCQALAQAMGNPAAILAKVGGISSCVQKQVQQMLQGEHPSDVDVIREEVDTARAELARYWTNACLEAWEDWGSRIGRVVLNAEVLLPQRPGRSDRDPTIREWEAWNEERKQSVSSVLTSIALTDDDLPTVTSGFCQNAMAELRRGKAIELPDRVNVTLDGVPMLRPRV